MRLIHPDDSAQQRELKVKAILRSSGQTLLETLAVWTRPRQRALKLVCSVHGKQHLDAALARGKGVLIAAPHYGNWELLLKYLAHRGPFSLVYRVPKKPYGEDFLKRARGGVNVTFADLHQKYITEDVDYDVYIQLMTPNGAAATVTRA